MIIKMRCFQNKIDPKKAFEDSFSGNRLRSEVCDVHCAQSGVHFTTIAWAIRHPQRVTQRHGITWSVADVKLRRKCRKSCVTSFRGWRVWCIVVKWTPDCAQWTSQTSDRSRLPEKLSSKAYLGSILFWKQCIFIIMKQVSTTIGKILCFSEEFGRVCRDVNIWINRPV